MKGGVEEVFFLHFLAVPQLGIDFLVRAGRGNSRATPEAG
jgi:hypothetical protein